MLGYLLQLGAGATAGADLAGGGTATAAAGGSLFGSFMPIILMVVVFYFLLMRPQKKQQKQADAMRSSLEVGDEIVTGGGIIGRIVSVHEETLLIETGSANTKLRIAKWAVQSNNTARDKQIEAAAAAKEKQAQEQPEKKGLFGRKKSEPEAGEVK